jgi:hypothetical protein
LSFAEVYTLLRKFTTPEESFDICNRVKRGFQDTAVPGAYYKDKVYWEGFLLVTDYLSKKPSMINILLAGKYSITQLGLANFPLADIKPYEEGISGIAKMVDFAANLISENSGFKS